MRIEQLSSPESYSIPDRGRIALFIRALTGGGAERSTVNLANGLADRGLAVDLLLARTEGVFAGKVSTKVRIVPLGVSSAFRAIPQLLHRPSNLFGLARLAFAPHSPKPMEAVPTLVDYLRSERPVALLSALDYANIAAVIAAEIASVRTRIVISQRNHFTAETAHANSWREKQNTSAFRQFYSKADRVVAVSKGVADDLVDACRISSGRVTTIYNAVSGRALDEQAAEAVDHPWFAPESPPIILAVGKLKSQKDFPMLMKAFAEVRRGRNARLIILGEGPQRSHLLELARQLGIEADVSLPGFVANPFAYMARANLFVLSSTFEGLPGVLIQALACGCPVVSTDCPSGPREILEDGRHGRLVPVGDTEGLAIAIRATLDAPPDRKDLKRRGAFFSVERSVDAYLDVLLG